MSTVMGEKHRSRSPLLRKHRSRSPLARIPPWIVHRARPKVHLTPRAAPKPAPKKEYVEIKFSEGLKQAKKPSGSSASSVPADRTPLPAPVKKLKDPLRLFTPVYNGPAYRLREPEVDVIVVDYF